MKSWMRGWFSDWYNQVLMLLVVVVLFLGFWAYSEARAKDAEPLGVGDLVAPTVNVFAREEQSFSVFSGVPTIIHGRARCIMYPEMSAWVLAMKDSVLALVEVRARPDSLGEDACATKSMVTVPLRYFRRDW